MQKSCELHFVTRWCARGTGRFLRDAGSTADDVTVLTKACIWGQSLGSVGRGNGLEKVQQQRSSHVHTMTLDGQHPVPDTLPVACLRACACLQQAGCTTAKHPNTLGVTFNRSTLTCHASGWGGPPSTCCSSIGAQACRLYGSRDLVWLHLWHAQCDQLLTVWTSLLPSACMTSASANT